MGWVAATSAQAACLPLHSPAAGRACWAACAGCAACCRAAAMAAAAAVAPRSSRLPAPAAPPSAARTMASPRACSTVRTMASRSAAGLGGREDRCAAVRWALTGICTRGHPPTHPQRTPQQPTCSGPAAALRLLPHPVRAAARHPGARAVGAGAAAPPRAHCGRWGRVGAWADSACLHEGFRGRRTLHLMAQPRACACLPARSQATHEPSTHVACTSRGRGRPRGPWILAPVPAAAGARRGAPGRGGTPGRRPRAPAPARALHPRCARS